ncbi:MAG TPA: acetyl-CoA carboxylase, carboxyltransferase subunit beta [Thermomicrobiales bacterium]|nr:acetyl-CoA carboxylase, carboxyltransferase subunit beta [Thermomicrobiales bacterium]
MRELFRRQPKFQPASEAARDSAGMPDDLFFKCPKCKELSYGREFREALHVCQKCGYHARLGARERLDLLLDPGSFVEWDAGLEPEDPLEFATEQERYPDKLRSAQRKTGLTEAAVSGQGAIEGRPLAIFVTDFAFLAASMGSVYGERLVRAVERAVERGLPLLTVSASSGARQHEGAFALMQMAKTTAALTRLGSARLPHFSLLADPCYGGVPASYATVADVILAEPGARVGFAGPRVIEQTTRQKLPEGFQTAEFLLEHGLVDLVVPRRELRATLARFLSLYGGCHREPAQRRPGADRAVDAVGDIAVPVVADARR